MMLDPRELGPSATPKILGSGPVDGPISLGSCADPREMGTDTGPKRGG